MNFDIAMPATLFAVVLAAMFLDKKVETKLKSTFEEKAFGLRDIVMLVIAMSVTVSLIVFVPQMAIMIIFLFAYSMLLFLFTYLFSNLQKVKAQLFCTAFIAISFLAAIVSLFGFDLEGVTEYGVFAFFGLFGFALAALVYEAVRDKKEERWYLAVLPPATFILLYLFFNGTPIWLPYLLDLYGIVFAVLIILYLGSLFTWRSLLIFVALLTFMDVILVLVTGTMVSAASHIQALQLPMLITVRTVPSVVLNGNVIWMSLGLGDFFFAGLIGIQSKKRFGTRFAILSVAAMTVSFFIFEIILLNYELTAFPGTLMILCGWLPLLLWKTIRRQNSKSKTEQER
jgi:hypothetical protein